MENNETSKKMAINTSKPKLLSDQFNWFTFNGHAAPSIPPITLNEGERVRIHFGSMAYQTYPISLHGHTWTLVGTEGGLIDSSAQIKGATLTLDPYTTRTIEFTAWNPGQWPLYSLNKHYCMRHNKELPTDLAPHGGMFTLIEVLKKDPAAKWVHPAAGYKC